jgi:hypothetical protein
MWPVTQTAEVEVNNATTRLFHVPLLVEIGSINSRVPTAITARNPKQIVLATVMGDYFKLRERIVQFMLSQVLL